MSVNWLLVASTVFTVALGLPAAHADDGGNGNPGSPFSKSMSQKLPSGGEAAHAFIDFMPRYVAAQAADGTFTTVEHHDIDGVLREELVEVKPQVGVFIYGPVEEVDTTEEIGFTGHGKRDAYAAVSLDDGNTWKLTNLSESGDQSSADFDREDVSLYSGDGINYPGDVINIAQATAGERVIVAWYSRYCGSGQPNYSLESGDPTRLDNIASFMDIDLSFPSRDDLYLTDMFRVAGQQQSVDYAEDKFEKNHPVGEVPYACLWSARGTLEQLDDGTNQIVWRKAERLTSGRRDVARVEVDIVPGAGAVITWQEDPEGLRPGQGLGPGAGWSGAVANKGTDVWYSYIEWEHFPLVQQEDAGGNPTGEIVPYADYNGTSNRPKVGIPLAMPMRMTDNEKCNITNPAPYCNGSAINNDGTADDVLNPLDYGMKDMCADTIAVATGPDDTLSEVCVTEDGMPLLGNMSATRPRVGLFGYDSNNDGVTDSGWVMFAAEEKKGLGKFGVDDQGVIGCDPEVDTDCEEVDVGKNMWYYSFTMSLNNQNIDSRDQLIPNLASHGNLLNQPAVDWQTGDFFQLANTDDLWDFGLYNFDIYQTEIARRSSLLAQDASNVAPDTTDADMLFADGFEGVSTKSVESKGTIADEGVVAFPTWKEGIMRQGGPADVMARRILLPGDYQEGTSNPYAFRNMACDTWAFADGSNPMYPDGVCLEPAINISSVTPDTCVDNSDGSTTDCPTVDPATGIGDTNPILQGGDVLEPNTDKVLTWHQCPSGASVVSSSDSITPVTACDDTASNRSDNTFDQSWYNPLDVAKGHRGFIDGDFIMILYAWSPNWKLNAKGKDRYELYVRRSFDGGRTWTTLPSSYQHLTDGQSYSGLGTVDCETFRKSDTGSTTDEPKGCFEYAAGEPQAARNVSQLKSMQFTVLDPRYAGTAASIEGTGSEEDVRNPSRYFIVYETGDNSTVEFGEAESLDLFYSRGVKFGDHYQVWAEEDDLSVCYPSDPHDDTNVSDVVAGSGFCNEFDDLERKKDITSGEGSIEANPDGSWLYGVWSQEDTVTGEFSAEWRRAWFIDGYISTDHAWDLPGQSQ